MGKLLMEATLKQQRLQVTAGIFTQTTKLKHESNYALTGHAVPASLLPS